jgi:serine/threonine-protein kinase
MSTGDDEREVTAQIGAPKRFVATLPDLLPPGTMIEQHKGYEIVEPVGEGGMGRVYRAYDPSMDRYVALKVLKPGASEEERQKFKREGVLAANFSHPNLIRVLEIGATGTLQWMAMEWLRGRDIGDVLGGGRQTPWRIIVDIFSQVLDALDYVHTRSIAHCDIKPENIFITRDGYDRGLVVVKVIDFGIARELKKPLEHSEYVTGDPRYLAPEQALLDNPFDVRVDLYALGMTLYEITTGRHPLDDYLHLDPLELLDLQQTMRFASPSKLLPANTPAAFKLAFDGFIARATAKSPEDRFRSAMEMKAALIGLMDRLK